METLFPELDRELANRRMHHSDLAKIAGTSENHMQMLLYGKKNWRTNEALSVWDYFGRPDIYVLFGRR